jgi:hypothetical protein
VVGAVDVYLSLHPVVKSFELPTGDALSVVGHVTTTDLAHADGGFELPPLDSVFGLQQTHAGLAGGVDGSHPFNVLSAEDHVLGVLFIFLDPLHNPAEAVLEHAAAHVNVDHLVLRLTYIGEFCVAIGEVEVPGHLFQVLPYPYQPNSGIPPSMGLLIYLNSFI